MKLPATLPWWHLMMAMAVSMLATSCASTGATSPHAQAVERVVGFARGACVACDSVCRFVPGSPQSGRAAAPAPTSGSP